MALSIDWATKVITVPQADLTPLGGSNYQHDTEAFHWALRDYMDSEDGMVHPPTHTWVGSKTLSGAEYAPLFEIINGYTVTYENGNYRVYLSGTNSNVLDVLNLNNVQVASQNSAGLIQISEVKDAAFNQRYGGVTIDVVNGEAGTSYPIGTKRRPVNNLADALTILTAQNDDHLYIRGDLTIGATDDVSDLHLIGSGANKTVLNFTSGCTTDNTEVTESAVTGTVTDELIIRRCYVYGLTVGTAFIHQCQIAGTLTLSNAQAARILSCYSEDELTIDMGGTGSQMYVEDHNGHIKLANKTDSQNTVIHFNVGAVTIQASVTDGTGIHIGGTGTYENLSGQTIDSHIIDPDKVWDTVLEGSNTAAEMMRIMMAALSGRTAGLGTATEQYKSINGVKTRIEATFDENSNRTTVVLDGSV